MMQFNKFHLGEFVHNRETSQEGEVVGFRDTADVPEYQVIIPIEPSQERGSCLTLMLWSETLLEPSMLGPGWTARFESSNLRSSWKKSKRQSTCSLQETE